MKKSVMDELKQYFLNTINKIGEINEVDEFAQLMLNIIKNGNVEINFKRLTETKVFDELWIKTFETYFTYIDNIIRNPRKILADEEELVPVERARNFSPKTVRHLSQNSQYVKEIDKQGMVIPTKVLSVRKEDFYGIYENRFIKTLINRVHNFIKRRYDVMMENAESYVNDSLEVFSSYNIDHKDVNNPKEGTFQEVNFRFNIDIKSELKDDKINKKNQNLLKRIDNLYRQAKSFKMSSFMIMMEKYHEILPPIQKTNIIMKNVDYQSAHKLWLFLDHYTSLGFDSDTEEKMLFLGNNYQSDIYSLILLSYITTEVNERKRVEGLKDVDYQNQIIKNKELKLPDGYQLLFENSELTPYFLKQSEVNYTERYNRLIKKGKSSKVAMETILTDILQLTNTIAKNFFKIAAEPITVFSENTKTDVDEKMKIIKEKTDILNRIIKVKEADLDKTKKDQERYLEQMRQLELEKAELVAQKMRQLEIEKAKATLIKEYKRQVAEEQERKRKMLEKIAQDERAKEAKRLKEKMKKQKEKEREKAKKAKSKSKQTKTSSATKGSKVVKETKTTKLASNNITEIDNEVNNNIDNETKRE